MASRIAEKENPGHGLRLVAQQKISRAITKIGSDTPLEEAFHEVRKRLKELRAILRLAEMPCEIADKLSAIFREASRRTTQVRDAQVQARVLQNLAEELRGTEGFELCEAEQKKLTGVAAHASTPQLRYKIHTQLVKAARLLDQWPPENIKWADVWKAWKKGRKQSLKAMNRALAEPANENLHKWRKRAKNWWYQTRLLEKRAPKKTAGLSSSLRVLTELIGDDHDLSLVEDDLAKSKAGGVASVRAVLKKRRATLQKEAAKRGRKIAEKF